MMLVLGGMGGLGITMGFSAWFGGHPVVGAGAGSLGALFVVVGTLGLAGRIGVRSRVFDKAAGVCVDARRRPSPSHAIGVAIDDIAALQICLYSVSLSGGGRNYTSHQLNMVLHDPPGERINLMDHGRSRDLRADARRLAEFLGVPVIEGQGVWRPGDKGIQ